MKIKLNAINATKLLSLAGILAILSFCSFIVGRYFVPPEMVLAILLSKVMNLPQFWPSDVEKVVIYLRLPRIVAAVLIGSALASAGAAYQGLFKNPLVSPDILGVSAGASFGAALGILLSFNALGIQGLAFLFGLLAVMSTYLISKWLCKNGDAILFMILAGIIVGTLFTSFVSLIKYVADPDTQITGNHLLVNGQSGFGYGQRSRYRICTDCVRNDNTNVTQMAIKYNVFWR